MTFPNKEHEHEAVYGQSFALYDQKEILAFQDFLKQRFIANKLDAQTLFNNKHCIDAGCGNGRGALFMLLNGAKHVSVLDISSENLESTSKNLARSGFANFSCTKASLECIPYENEKFDFVWCNGVLMHTANPDACLRELARILKVGGKTWLYVYGSNGFYWYLIRIFREWFKAVNADVLLHVMQMMRLPVRYIGEYMDDWKVPYLRAYTDKDFAARLKNIGFGEVTRLWRGVSFDTSERRLKFPQDLPWLGEGDLRYLATKTEKLPKQPAGLPLSDGQFGSIPSDAPEIAGSFNYLLEDLRRAIGDDLALAIVVAAHLQRELRDVMSLNAPFDHAGYESFVRRTLSELGQLQSAQENFCRT